MDLSSNERVRSYIKRVCSQIKFRDIHHEIRLELETHIQEIAEEHLANGFSEDEAIEQAMKQMGDPDTVGEQLNKVHKPKPEWSILLISLLFLSFGPLTMYFVQQQELLIHHSRLFEKSLFYSLIGIVLIPWFYLFDYRKLEKYSKHIYVVTLLILSYTVFWGYELNGSSCWLSLGPFMINFVSITPLLFTIAFAGIFAKWHWDSITRDFQALALFLAPLLLILSAPSLTAAVIYTAACIVLMTVSGGKLRSILFITSPVIFAVLLLAVLAPQWLAKFFMFLNPAQDPLGAGYLNMQLSEVLSSSGYLGQGLSFAPGMLPDLHTDFIFAFITYTFGWTASILLIALIIVFLVRVALIAKQVKTSYAKLLISGIVGLLTLQFLWHIAMNLGIAPIAAVGLPFISYGGSQLVINAAAVGIILSIYRRKNISQTFQVYKTADNPF